MRVFRLGAAGGGRRRCLTRSNSGAAAVEFALVGPVLLVLIAGILSYGGYFWTAHTVQQVANDAARAAIPGLDDRERLQLAQAAALAEIDDLGPFAAQRTAVSAQRQGDTLTIQVGYDASNSPFWAFSGLIPMPSKRVMREATIRLGGF